MNRRDGREAAFPNPGDDDAFIGATYDTRACMAVDLPGDCLMSDHFHVEAGPDRTPNGSPGRNSLPSITGEKNGNTFVRSKRKLRRD